jgi:hypothetical protein
MMIPLWHLVADDAGGTPPSAFPQRIEMNCGSTALNITTT